MRLCMRRPLDEASIIPGRGGKGRKLLSRWVRRRLVMLSNLAWIKELLFLVFLLLQSVELLGSVKHNEQGSMQAFLAGRPKGEWYSSLITNPPVSDFLTSNTKALKLHPFHLYQTQYYYSHLPYVAHMLGWCSNCPSASSALETELNRLKQDW